MDSNVYQSAKAAEVDVKNMQEMLDKNRNAWDKSCEEYTTFCKAYYINLVLTNRFQ